MKKLAKMTTRFCHFRKTIQDGCQLDVCCAAITPKMDYKKLNKEKLIEILHEKDAQLISLNARIDAIEKQLKSNSDIKIVERIESIEKNCYRQEQYSRRECVEIVGLPGDIVNQEALEAKVIETFKFAGVEVTSRDFHAVHRLKNQAVVIAKLVNRRDATAILRAKKKLRETDVETQKKLGVKGKIYVNESLCPAYRRLFGVCNALFRKKKLVSSYTINGSIMVCKDEGGEKKSIGHINDLKALFKEGEVEKIMKEHSDKVKAN